MWICRERLVSTLVQLTVENHEPLALFILNLSLFCFKSAQIMHEVIETGSFIIIDA